MKDATETLPMTLMTPSRVDVQRALADARRMFHRSLSSWASDVLAIRHAGRDLPSWSGSKLHRAA